MVDGTVDVTFWVTGIVFIAVNLFMAWAVWKYRHREGLKAHYEPENKKLEWWLTIITSVGIAAMLAPGLSAWAKFVKPPDDASIVEVFGQQWFWSYRFPGPDGKLGATDARLVSLDNPFGIEASDPAATDDILIANTDLHLPVNRPVKLLLRSRDVNHQFAVPQFRVKMDMIPGMVTYFWLTPSRTGTFDALCEQLCGIAHFAMRGRVVVDEQAEFDEWLAGRTTFAEQQAEISGDPEQGAAHYALCSSCHGAQGEGNEALNAPKLSGQSGWYMVRQLHDFRAGIRGANPEDTYAQQMIPFAVQLPDEQAIRDVVAYIGTLPDEPAAQTLSGDAGRGRSLYSTCSVCHGAEGQGTWATNAPRLADMSDWYLARQLRNFRDGVRGRHPQDFNGAQMAAMAKMLRDDEAIGDLLAYIKTQ
jgi:cytochrome c oxidase subunit 2